MCIVEKKCLRKQMPASASSLLWSFPKRSAPSGIASNQRQQTANACVKGPCCFASTYLEKSSSLAGSILIARFSQSNGNRGGAQFRAPSESSLPETFAWVCFTDAATASLAEDVGSCDGQQVRSQFQYVAQGCKDFNLPGKIPAPYRWKHSKCLFAKKEKHGAQARAPTMKALCPSQNPCLGRGSGIIGWCWLLSCATGPFPSQHVAQRFCADAF